MQEANGEGGQVLPLVTVVILLAGLACLLVGRLGGAAVARAQAMTAADAAALAGAAADREAAEAAASANGGRLIRFERVGSDTRVRVELGGAGATARARPGATGGQEGGRPAPAMRAALARAEQLLGAPVPVSRHEGLAVEVPASFVPRLAAVASRAGLCRPRPETDPVHFGLCVARLP